MGPVLSLSRSEYSVVWLPAGSSVDTTMPPADMPPADSLKNDPVPGNEALPPRDRLAASRFVMAFCIGVAATLAWQSCSDAARQLVGTPSVQFGGGAARVAQTGPDVMISPATFGAATAEAQFLAMPEQNVDQLAAPPRQIDPSVVQVASAREQIARDFASLQQRERHVMSVPLPRPAPAETRKHASRPATASASAGPNVHHAVASSAAVWSSSASPVLSTHLDAGRKRIRSSAATPRSSAPEPFSQGLVLVSESLISALSRITGIQL